MVKHVHLARFEKQDKYGNGISRVFGGANACGRHSTLEGIDMDPIAYLFSAYLNSVQTSVHKQLTETMGTEVKALQIHYQGTEIPFTYQMWRIQSASICAPYSERIAQYSACTVKAQSMFKDLCRQLTDSGRDDWQLAKTRNMYCVAAVNFEPTIAKVELAREPSEIDQARQECNKATVRAMGKHEPELETQRKDKCGVYEQLKGQDTGYLRIMD